MLIILTYIHTILEKVHFFDGIPIRVKIVRVLNSVVQI